MINNLFQNQSYPLAEPQTEPLDTQEPQTEPLDQSKNDEIQCIQKVFRALDLFHIVTLKPYSKND
jgi:hypothetical protein